MHEAGFTEQIVSSIFENLQKEPRKPIKKIVVRVGEVFHLQPQSVLMHYQLLTNGTNLEKIEVDLQEIPVTVECLRCKKTGGVEDHHLMMCSHCDSTDVKILAGNSIETELIEDAP